MSSFHLLMTCNLRNFNLHDYFAIFEEGTTNCEDRLKSETMLEISCCYQLNFDVFILIAHYLYACYTNITFSMLSSAFND